MKAIICTRYGPPEVLQLGEVERPIRRRNQVRIRIVAITVTVSDCVIRGLRAPRRVSAPIAVAGRLERAAPPEMDLGFVDGTAWMIIRITSNERHG